MSFSRSSLTVRKVLTHLGCTEQMVPDQRLVLELGVSGLPKPLIQGLPTAVTLGTAVCWPLQTGDTLSNAPGHVQVSLQYSQCSPDISFISLRLHCLVLQYHFCLRVTLYRLVQEMEGTQRWWERMIKAHTILPLPNQQQLTFFKPEISLTTATSSHRFIFTPSSPKTGKREWKD